MGNHLSRAELNRLVSQHMEAVHNFAIRLTGNAHTAEDIMQEALLKASKHWRTFKGQSSFRTWLIRIVINAFRDHIRCERVRTDDLPDEIRDLAAVDPATGVDASDVGEIVAGAVSSLPPRQREGLVLKTYEGLSTQATADLLGIDEKNVRTNLHHARTKLRQLLGAYLREDSR